MADGHTVGKDAIRDRLINNRSMRWGILGTARVARHLIPLLHASPEDDLTAVASRSAARAEEFARHWNIPEAYGSYDALLRDDRIEVVYVALPNSLHAEWTIAALRSGKHVLCEKPLATNAGDVDAIIAAASNATGAATEGFMFRYHAQTAELLRLLADGAIGEVRSVAASFSYIQNRPGDVRLDPALGGGAIWDIGCYLTYYARLAMGREPVRASGWRERGPTGVDVAFAGTLHFDRGAYAQIDGGFRSAYRSTLEIAGTEGVLRVPNPFKPDRRERLVLSRPDRSDEIIEIEGNAWFWDGIDEIRRLAAGLPARLPLADSRANVAALEAFHASAHT